MAVVQFRAAAIQGSRTGGFAGTGDVTIVGDFRYSPANRTVTVDGSTNSSMQITAAANTEFTSEAVLDAVAADEYVIIGD